MASKVWNLKSSTPEGWNFCKLYLETPSEINYLWISWPVAEIASLFHSSGCAAHIVWLNTSTAQITSFPFADFFPSRESIQTWILGRALLLGCEWKCGRQGTHWGCSAPGTLIGVLGQCSQYSILCFPCLGRVSSSVWLPLTEKQKVSLAILLKMAVENLLIILFSSTHF